MNRNTLRHIAAGVLVLTGILVSSEASAQVNCRATNNPSLRASCQRQMMQQYQRQSQYYTNLDRRLGAVQGGIRAGQFAGGFIAKRAAGPQGQAVWGLSKRAGTALGDVIMRNPRVQRWNGRLYGLQ